MSDPGPGPAGAGPLRVLPDDLTDPRVHALLADHLADLHAVSPPESVHALDLDRLRGPDITFFAAWSGSTPVGCGALHDLGDGHGEVKSMRTATTARGRGVSGAVLTRLLAEARERGMRRISLETGTEEFFASARRLYARHGFVPCEPFGDYRPDPFSAHFTREL